MKKKTRLLFLAFTLLIVTILSACGNSTDKKDADSQAENYTINPGVLTIGTHYGYVPMEYYDENQEAKGFDIELAEAISEEMGMELVIVSCAWDAIFKNMEDGSFDAIISSVSYTEERDEKYAFSEAYLSNGLALVVPKDSDIKSIEDIANNSENNAIGVQLDTTADYVARGYVSDSSVIEIAQYENITYAMEAMERGELAAVCTDSVVANYFIHNNPEYKISWESEEAEPLCICIKDENVQLQNRINEALSQLKDNGKLEEISTKYFGTDITEN